MNIETDEWHNIRKNFELDNHYIHLSNGVLSSHPLCVKQAIEKYRKALDQNPTVYVKNHDKFNQRVLNKAAEYLSASQNLIALTESTTMGLGLIYHGLKLMPHDEILTTYHEHYATQEALKSKCYVSGAKLKKIKLYENSFEAEEDELVQQLTQQISDKTRVVALTWVHSCSGLKLPIAKIGEFIQGINAHRLKKEKILFCVDGVHALGIENFKIDELYCDFFIAGCHKSLFGPRGTGFVWGNIQAWQRIEPIIPSFDDKIFLPWLKNEVPKNNMLRARFCTPGGFTVFEHRWALEKAFEFHLNMGKSIIADRVHYLNHLFKQALLEVPRIKLHTPVDKNLSSGIICFEISGKAPAEIVKALFKRKIIAGQTPYADSYVRFMPGIYNIPEEVEKTLFILRDIIG